MKLVQSLAAFLIFGASVAAVGEESSQKINSKESLRICKSAVEAELADGESMKFARKAATSVEAGIFKHWINATQLTNNEKSSVKVLCETSRTGEVVTMQMEEGRWKF